MADQKPPDYGLEDTLILDTPEQHRALFEETRIEIVDLLNERAATIKELADTLGKPKGTIGHHIQVLADAGLIRVVRTKKVRAIEAKYYGRTARWFIFSKSVGGDTGMSKEQFLATAAAEFAKAPSTNAEKDRVSTLRYARIPTHRAEEWVNRLVQLTDEFIEEERSGDTTYALVTGIYPTDRPHLPDPEESA